MKFAAALSKVNPAAAKDLGKELAWERSHSVPYGNVYRDDDCANRVVRILVE
jgi:hypothetical protein